MNFRWQSKPKNSEKKRHEEDVLKVLYNLSEDRERVLHAFDSKILTIKIEGTGFSDKVLNHSKY